MIHSHNFVRILALITTFTVAFATLPNVQATRMWVSGGTEFINPASAPIKFVNPAGIPTLGDADLDKIIYHAGEEYGVDPCLINAVIWQESRYKPKSRSHVGTQGLMPATAKRFKCRDANDPKDNVEAGTKQMRRLLKRFNGDVSLALAAYNPGEGFLYKYVDMPPYSETQGYFGTITSRYGRAYQPVAAPEEVPAAFNLMTDTIIKYITIHGYSGYGTMAITKLPGGWNKLTINESVTFDSPDEGSGAGRVEVLTVSRSGGREVYNKRIYYAPALNPGKVRKYRQPSSPTAEMLPVGAEFTFWAGEGDDPSPISDKVTITVQAKNNVPVTLQLNDSVARRSDYQRDSR